MDYAIVAVPAAPVRRKPRHSKEMVSQLLFGETVRILKERGDLWVKIRSLHDNYEGWMTNSLLEPVEESVALTRSPYVTTELLSFVIAPDKKINIPVGSSLPLFDNGVGKLGEIEYSFTGRFFNRNEQKPGPDLIRQLTMAWLNAPYLWGGRTPLGVDCSGFVQVIYKLMGIDLPRDAWQQAQEGKPVKKFSGAQAGDLVFFDRGEEIVHVGILIGSDQMIHASGKVKIDTITKKGLTDPVSGKKILRLEAIRRI